MAQRKKQTARKVSSRKVSNARGETYTGTKSGRSRTTAQAQDSRSNQKGATFTRLRSGEWGVRVVGANGNKLAGREINVDMREGGTKRIKLKNLIWAGRMDNKDVALYGIVPEYDNGGSW